MICCVVLDREAEVKKLLEESLEVGRVVIVTNALEPWVTTSCKNFFPGLLPIIQFASPKTVAIITF